MTWAYTYDAHFWPALIVLGAIAVLGWYSWRHRKVPAAIPFIIGCSFVSLWALGAALEVSAVDFVDKIFWFKFQIYWQLPTATAFTCFILVYAGLRRLLTRRNLVLLTLPPLIVIGIILTNNYHHLMWTNFNIDQYIIPVPGALNRVFIGYGYILGLLNVVVLIWLAIHSPRHRPAVAIMILGQVIGRGVILVDYLHPGLFGPGEFVLFSLGVLSATYAVAFFRFHVIDPISVACTTAMEQMNDGMIVLDSDKYIVDLNPAAATILGRSEVDLRVKQIESVLPSDSPISTQLNKTTSIESEISLNVTGIKRYYYLSITYLVDKHKNIIGRLLLLHDVTEQKQAQTMIIEQQHALATLQERERLARELHDGIGQVLGYTGVQAQAVRKYIQDGNYTKADSLLERLIQVAQNAHLDVRESILNLRINSTLDWSFVSALKQYLNNYQTNYGIHTELIIADGIEENTFERSTGVQLLRAIQETLTNARKHSNASNVRVIIEQNVSTTHITVVDDGCGFNYDQYDRNNDGHFGLVFMRERMEQIGGSLKIDSRPGEGTIVTLYVPFHQQMEEEAR